MVRLDDACRELGVPLLLARSYGLVGYLRASLPEHCVVESKPDNSVEDLRRAACRQSLACFQDLGSGFSLPEHCAVESKPDNTVADLRRAACQCSDVGII